MRTLRHSTDVLVERRAGLPHACVGLLPLKHPLEHELQHALGAAVALGELVGDLQDLAGLLDVVSVLLMFARSVRLLRRGESIEFYSF